MAKEKEEKGLAYEQAWNCTCNGCGKKFRYGDENSPVLNNRLWRSLLTYYQISEDEEYARERKYLGIYKKWKMSGEKDDSLFEEMRKPEYHVLFCTDCMEKAFGRKLMAQDIQDCPYNSEFREKYLGEETK